MPTFDITAPPYSATGDGQLATATLSITAGLKILTSTTAIFNTTPNAENGKYLAVTGAGAAGGVLFGGLITASSPLSDGKQVTLTNAASTTLTASVQQVEWGHDDAGAFNTFYTNNTGTPNVILTIPPGRYCFAVAFGFNGFFWGFPSLTINGDSGSNPIFSDMLGVGGGFFMGGSISGHHTAALTQTVTAGSTVITLITNTDSSLFSANSWALMTGLETQGSGDLNPQFHEHVFITAVHAGTGGGDPSTVTIQSPLVNIYKSTWPFFNVGGPAQLWQMYAGWDCVHVYNNLIMSSVPTGWNAFCRDLTINGGSSTHYGPVPSTFQNLTITNYSVANQWEWDKSISSATVSNSFVHSFNIQSPSPNTLILNNVTYDNMNGSPRNLIMTNCVCTNVGGGVTSFGPNSTGASVSVTATNCDFTGGFIFGGNYENDVEGVGAYTMSGGVISRARTGGSGGPPLWASPGSFCFFSSRYMGDELFKIVDVVYNSGPDTVDIITDQVGTWPSLISPATGLTIRTHPAPSLTFNGCFGSDPAGAWSNAPAGKPIYSYWKKTYTASSSYIIPMLGTVVSIKFTVNPGFSAGTFGWAGGAFVIKKPSNVEQLWNPVIDLKTPGTRTLTPSDPTGGPQQGTDSGLALPQSNIWLVENQMQPQISGAVGSGSITLEIITDQGFPLSPSGIGPVAGVVSYDVATVRGRRVAFYG